MDFPITIASRQSIYSSDQAPSESLSSNSPIAEQKIKPTTLAQVTVLGSTNGQWIPFPANAFLVKTIQIPSSDSSQKQYANVYFDPSDKKYFIGLAAVDNKTGKHFFAYFKISNQVYPKSNNWSADDLASFRSMAINIVSNNQIQNRVPAAALPNRVGLTATAYLLSEAQINPNNNAQQGSGGGSTGAALQKELLEGRSSARATTTGSEGNIRRSALRNPNSGLGYMKKALDVITLAARSPDRAEFRQRLKELMAGRGSDISWAEPDGTKIRLTLVTVNKIDLLQVEVLPPGKNKKIEVFTLSATDGNPSWDAAPVSNKTPNKAPELKVDYVITGKRIEVKTSAKETIQVSVFVRKKSGLNEYGTINSISGKFEALGTAPANMPLTGDLLANITKAVRERFGDIRSTSDSLPTSSTTSSTPKKPSTNPKRDYVYTGTSIGVKVSATESLDVPVYVRRRGSLKEYGTIHSVTGDFQALGTASANATLTGNVLVNVTKAVRERFGDVRGVSDASTATSSKPIVRSAPTVIDDSTSSAPVQNTTVPSDILKNVKKYWNRAFELTVKPAGKEDVKVGIYKTKTPFAGKDIYAIFKPGTTELKEILALPTGTPFEEVQQILNDRVRKEYNDPRKLSTYAASKPTKPADKAYLPENILADRKLWTANLSLTVNPRGGKSEIIRIYKTTYSNQDFYAILEPGKQNLRAIGGVPAGTPFANVQKDVNTLVRKLYDLTSPLDIKQWTKPEQNELMAWMISGLGPGLTSEYGQAVGEGYVVLNKIADNKPLMQRLVRKYLEDPSFKIYNDPAVRQIISGARKDVDDIIDALEYYQFFKAGASLAIGGKEAIAAAFKKAGASWAAMTSAISTLSTGPGRQAALNAALTSVGGGIAGVKAGAKSLIDRLSSLNPFSKKPVTTPKPSVNATLGKTAVAAGSNLARNAKFIEEQTQNLSNVGTGFGLAYFLAKAKKGEIGVTTSDKIPGLPVTATNLFNEASASNSVGGSKHQGQIVFYTTKPGSKEADGYFVALGTASAASSKVFNIQKITEDLTKGAFSTNKIGDYIDMQKVNFIAQSLQNADPKKNKDQLGAGVRGTVAGLGTGSVGVFFGVRELNTRTKVVTNLASLNLTARGMKVGPDGKAPSQTDDKLSASGLLQMYLNLYTTKPIGANPEARASGLSPTVGGMQVQLTQQVGGPAGISFYVANVQPAKLEGNAWVNVQDSTGKTQKVWGQFTSSPSSSTKALTFTFNGNKYTMVGKKNWDRLFSTEALNELGSYASQNGKEVASFFEAIRHAFLD